MAVASLLDLGASEEAVRARRSLRLWAGEGFELHVGRVEKAGSTAVTLTWRWTSDGHDHDMAYL